MDQLISQVEQSATGADIHQLKSIITAYYCEIPRIHKAAELTLLCYLQIRKTCGIVGRKRICDISQAMLNQSTEEN